MYVRLKNRFQRMAVFSWTLVLIGFSLFFRAAKCTSNEPVYMKDAVFSEEVEEHECSGPQEMHANQMIAIGLWALAAIMAVLTFREWRHSQSVDALVKAELEDDRPIGRS